MGRGWNLRFGLVKLNVETQERSLRRSGELYGEICRRGLIDDGLVYEYAPGVGGFDVSGLKAQLDRVLKADRVFWYNRRPL